jgi:hypothetical protein
MPVIEVNPIEFLASEPEMILASSDSGKGPEYLALPHDAAAVSAIWGSPDALQGL